MMLWYIIKFIIFLILIFAIGQLIGHIFRFDDYLKYGSARSPK
ncbi:MAG: hypothetical protein Q8868_01580 [Bacteroidota bacterium]|nr:hypothetical protein [Bacteroidota bacterium]